MSYEDFREYLTWLKLTQITEIHWPVIDIDAVDARDHSTRASLQIADAIASAFAAGVEPDGFGNCESRYSEILKPLVYHRRNNYMSYGYKTVPSCDAMQLSNEQLRTIKHYK